MICGISGSFHFWQKWQQGKRQIKVSPWNYVVSLPIYILFGVSWTHCNLDMAEIIIVIIIIIIFISSCCSSISNLFFLN